MKNKEIRFILCVSSARKLMRHEDLLGERALRIVLYMLVSAEIPDFDFMRAINNGTIPHNYAVENPQKQLQAYIGDNLNEEIRAEAFSHNLSSFTSNYEDDDICYEER